MFITNCVFHNVGFLLFVNNYLVRNILFIFFLDNSDSVAVLNGVPVVLCYENTKGIPYLGSEHIYL